MSRLFSSCGQSIGASVNIQGWFPLVWFDFGLTSLQSRGLSRVFSSTTTWNYQFFSAQSSLGSNFHIHTWLLEKPWLWLYRPLSAKWCLCLFNVLSRFVILVQVWNIYIRSVFSPPSAGPPGEHGWCSLIRASRLVQPLSGETEVVATGPPGSCSGASFYQHSQQKYDFFIFVTIWYKPFCFRMGNVLSYLYYC